VPVGSNPADADLRHAAQTAFSNDVVKRIAVAVSGGSDSMASLHLMVRVAAREGWDIRAVTVDHALRAESAAEAAQVSQVCAALGVDHTVLTWAHGAVRGNLMDAARQARYALMAAWAADQKVSHIVLGHTADDQAETFLMGLSRSAGLDGLIGMARQWDEGAVRFVRPFLMQGRARLRQYLHREGLGWIDDPSNDNTQFTRVKMRRALAVLQPLGITVDALTTVISHLHDARDAVLAASQVAGGRICQEVAGEVIFDRDLWRGEVGEVRRRLLIMALNWISGAAHPPRGAGVKRVEDAIAEGRGATLAGCRIIVSQTVFRIVREPRAVAGLVAQGGSPWDGRWQVEGPFAPGQDVRALGMGLRQCKGWRATGFSRDALSVSPAVWQDDTLIAAPLAGFGADFRALILRPFNQFVLSH
jgi:tRNA(Ile)-lysidine synthase